VKNFYEARQSSSRDQKEKSRYEGLQRKITSTEFVLDLALICDALQELSELSLELQDRSIDLYAANQKIKALVQVFKERPITPGPYYEMAATAVERLQFQGVALHTSGRVNDPPIDVTAFYTKLHKSNEKNCWTAKTQTLRNGRVCSIRNNGQVTSVRI